MTAYLKGAKASWIWLVLRLYVGFHWLDAGWHKLTGPTPFDTTGFLKGAIAKAVPATPGARPAVLAWWASFLQGFALPNAKLFSFAVQWGEILVGLALMFGFATLFAALMGMTMNLAFLLSGSTSINPNLLALQVVLVALGAGYAGYYGVDFRFRPWYRGRLKKLTTVLITATHH